MAVWTPEEAHALQTTLLIMLNMAIVLSADNQWVKMFQDLLVVALLLERHGAAIVKE